MCDFHHNEYLLVITVIKIGVPDRWDCSVMVRGIAGDGLAARCISVPTVRIPQLGKTTCPNTFVPILERNLLLAPIVLIELHLRITWDSTSARTLAWILTPVGCVIFAQTVKIYWITTSGFTRERNSSCSDLPASIIRK